jgi:lipopolysaccharide/colanic/teichoic acid biosynthesis glycosyltransferase
MSLVGPRPTSFHASTYELWQTERLDVPAGLTGLWQVVARGSSEFDERCRLDIEYIRNRSWWLDAKILILTVAAVMARRGAY